MVIAWRFVQTSSLISPRYASAGAFLRERHSAAPSLFAHFSLPMNQLAPEEVAVWLTGTRKR